MTTDELNLTEVSWGDHRVRLIKIKETHYMPIIDIAKSLALRKRSLHNLLDHRPEIFIASEMDLYIPCPSRKQIVRCLNKTGIVSLLSRLRTTKKENVCRFSEWVEKNLCEQNTIVLSDIQEKINQDRYSKYLKITIAGRNYYAERREKYKNYRKEYALKNPEKLRLKYRKYHQSPNGRISAKNQKYFRRAKTKGYKITIEQWDKIIRNQNSSCNYCHKKFNPKRLPTMDHITPLSKGGTHTFENIQALCGKCNLIKHTKVDKGHIHTWISFKEITEVET